ncbi:hypothetical protein [Streptomyces sp. NBC_00620]|uniref:hypothetical protein n=1 Tax=Streptomyces sp. NBC_00620 TaxID=2903666 RepID=UPI00224F5794|nr:hypothetical protein [Streptomyces sp. NBC_00620]MCX4972183.1 hypothetical protein [Streptomyces sp. NBC_00620]
MTTPHSQGTAPPSVIAAGGVFLPAEVCHPLWLALRAQLMQHRAEGGRVRPEVAAALDALRAASQAHMSANGHSARTSVDIEPSSDRELISTEQLAVRLRVTERHARRLAAQAGVTPAARNAWHPDDAQHLVNSHKETDGCPPPRQHPPMRSP